MFNKFTRYILIAMALGVVMGAVVYEYLPQDRADIASSVNLIALAFLRLIKMIIAPLVFATLAFATDDVLLYGLIARHKAQDRMKVVGDYLSYDPYGIMFRKGEPQLAAVVERTFRRLATDRDLVPIYRKWFMARLPTGERLGIAISPQLEEAFKVLDTSPTAGN